MQLLASHVATTILVLFQNGLRSNLRASNFWKFPGGAYTHVTPLLKILATGLPSECMEPWHFDDTCVCSGGTEHRFYVFRPSLHPMESNNVIVMNESMNEKQQGCLHMPLFFSKANRAYSRLRPV